MQPQLLLAILAGLGGMLGWGFADFFAKKTIDKIGDVTTLFWAQSIGIVPILLLFLVHPVFPNLGTGSLIYLCILGVWSGLSYIPTYIAFGKGKVSLLSPIFASYAVVVALLSALFFGEIISPGHWVAFAIVFIGIVLINGDPKSIISFFKSPFSKRKSSEPIGGLKEITLAVALYSLWFIAFDRFINGHYWVPLLLVVRIFSALAILLYVYYAGRNLIVRDRNLWKYLILIGVFDVAAFAAVSAGFSGTPYVSVVAMISAGFSLPTIFLARVFLKEKTTRSQMVGSLIIVLGVMLLFLI